MDEPNIIITFTPINSGTDFTLGPAITFTIADDDFGVGLGASGGRVEGNERIVTEGSDITLTIIPEKAPENDLPVKVEVKGGANFDIPDERDDNDPPNPRTVIIPSDTSTHPVTFTLSPIDDLVDEENATLTVSIVTGDDYVAGSQTNPASVTVTLEDDDTIVSVAIADDEIEEGQQVSFTVSTGVPVQEETVVNYTVTVNDGLTDAGDFGIEAHEGTLTILPGQRSAESSSLDSANLEKLLTESDDVDEMNGSVTVTVLPGSGYTVGTSSDTVSIINLHNPDVNEDDEVNANDALILYYSYSLRSSLGTGR